MDCSNAMDRLIECLLTQKPPESAVPDEVVAHIAGCRACIEELDALSSALTGEPSALQAETDRLLFGESPNYNSFEEWFRLQHGEAAPFAEVAAPAKVSLWQDLTQELHRLITEIPILIGKTAASFGQLPPLLAPQLAPVGVYRTRASISATGEGEALGELLELPHAEANLVLKIHRGPVFDGKGTLVLEVGAIRPPQPIAEARVTLRDEDGGLLEGTSTDADGLAFFRELDLGKYIIQVEHVGQTWEFAVTLQELRGPCIS